MKDKIITTVTSIRTLDTRHSRYEDVFVEEKFVNYYLCENGGTHFLFSTPYKESEFKRFSGGINCSDVMQNTCSKKDALLRSVFEKLQNTVSDFYKSRKAQHSAA